MEQYIPKSALVAEIERRKHKLLDHIICESDKEWVVRTAHQLNRILLFLDTLEVKEVDLEKYYHEFLQKEWFGNLHVRTVSEMMAFTAKHFFELGMRSTITEKDCKLIWNIGDEIPNMPEEEFFKELLKRYKAQKGE